jgi:hypothetical protein
MKMSDKGRLQPVPKSEWTWTSDVSIKSTEVKKVEKSRSQRTETKKPVEIQMMSSILNHNRPFLSQHRAALVIRGYREYGVNKPLQPTTEQTAIACKTCTYSKT